MRNKRKNFAQLKKLANRATPGPWEVGDHPSKVVAPCPCCGLIATCEPYGPSEEPSCYNSAYIAAYNSEYIAAANPKTILALFKEMDKLQKFKDSWDC